jgi:G:T/U-mismatch repair DNA glycosylase
MLVKHKFLDSYPLVGKKILIIGTFNPDVPCNGAEFFYGRAKNYFWDLLPSMFAKESLKGDVQKQKKFLELHDIELSDLILSVELSKEDICSYGDDKLTNVIEYNTDNILEILKKGKTKEVYFTRKSFDKSVENIKTEIYKIKDFCEKNSIKFRFLPTPARFLTEKKCQEWRECFNQTVN